MRRILDDLLAAAAPAETLDGLDAWWRRHRESARPYEQPVDRAMAGAFGADRLGYAFASGYHEALRALIPELGERRCALCATEAGGNHPRAIETRLDPDGDGWRVTGTKQWTTMGREAEELLVFATEGVDDRGRNRIALVRVPASRDGVTVSPGSETPFVPEIPHATLRLEAVRVEPAERLPGDGYARYLKPFRTVEDAHVHAALLAWLLQVGRGWRWPEAACERIAVRIAAARGLALADPTSPGVHIALAGLIDETARLLDELETHWAAVDEGVGERWRRDRPLLGVAGAARARRLEVAWAALRS